MDTLQLYSRKGCHLCDVMEQGLRRLSGQITVSWQKIDVDLDPRLQALYGEHVPVLADGAGKEICRHRLDEAALKDALR